MPMAKNASQDQACTSDVTGQTHWYRMTGMELVFKRFQKNEKNIGPTRIVEGFHTQSSLVCGSKATLAIEASIDQKNHKSASTCHPHLHSSPVLPSKHDGLSTGNCNVQVADCKEMHAI